MKSAHLHIKRVYEEPATSDGTRVLVDRLWPRGLSKEKAHLDHWYKEVAPSPALRKWFGHEEERFKEFEERYLAELKENKSEELERLAGTTSSGKVTLLYGAKDEKVNHAVVLQKYLSGQAKKSGAKA